MLLSRQSEPPSSRADALQLRSSSPLVARWVRVIFVRTATLGSTAGLCLWGQIPLFAGVHPWGWIPLICGGWKWEPIGVEVTDSVQDYPCIYSGEKRLFSALGDDSFYPTMRGHSHTHHESSTYIATTSSYAVLPHSTTISSPYYHDSNRYPPGLASSYGLTGLAGSSQMRQASSRQLEQPYQNRHVKKY
ncbi:hypothetical protein GUJ93_ZPchr0016g2564 [Zizania palustris]|uniref:Uncharacterized protein n=1 Tax=Zizania palustris TaxID=103762 RepID=A0A8J5W155_ZIZPA|nr:hypothetical protein GUJ93_ZPchr0016g2564 [Zizania palustris]